MTTPLERLRHEAAFPVNGVAIVSAAHLRLILDAVEKAQAYLVRAHDKAYGELQDAFIALTTETET